MSELFDKELMHKKSLRKLPGFTQVPASPRNKETRKKRRAPKKFFDGKEFIGCMQKTGIMDIKRLQVTNSSYIEGTICLVNE